MNRRPMSAQLVLLRAINVGGHNVIPMADLRSLLGELGFEGASTYLQSGNIILVTERSPGAIAANIHDGIAERFGHDVVVLTRSADELAAIVAEAPWQYPANSSSGVVFMSDEVAALDASAFEPDACVVAGRDIHVDCPTGFGKTKLSVAWIERQTGLAGTRRNWKSVKALAQRLDEID